MTSSVTDQFQVAKPRMRICFDPETEIPKLQKWFAENNHPTRQQVFPLDFWKIGFEKSSWMNLIFLSISKLNFAGYTGSKYQVQTRQKIKFVQLDFSNSFFQTVGGIGKQGIINLCTEWKFHWVKWNFGTKLINWNKLIKGNKKIKLNKLIKRNGFDERKWNWLSEIDKIDTNSLSFFFAQVAIIMFK